MRAALMKVEPVSTECYVVRYTKKEALEGFEALLRRRGEDDIPVMPFMFQTANGSSFKGSLFFVFKTAEDALHRIRRIAVERCYRGDGIFSPPITQIYEHQPGDSERITFLILDCETYLRYFEGKEGMDTAAIDAVMQRFPCWFYEQLRDRRFILADETVTVVVKRKSRAVGEGDFKISYHFIVEIAGTPVWHSAVCNEIFMPLAADIKEIQSSKSVGHLSDAQIRVPAFYCDIATFHGHQGFATYFSLKNPNDPPSTLICRLAFRRGAEVARKDFIPGPHDPAGDLALGFLTHASYTLAKAYVGNYADSVGVLAIPKHVPGGTATKKKGPSNSALRPRGRGSGSDSPQDLPGWVERLLEGHGGLSGCVWNYAYPCLGRYAESFKAGLETEEVTCVHVKNFPCPARLCHEDTLQVYRHSSNGIILVIVKGEAETILYAKCCDCRLRSRALHPLVSPVVNGAWLRWTEEVFGALLDVSSTEGKSKKDKVDKAPKTNKNKSEGGQAHENKKSKTLQTTDATP